jgi:hypothetical protein
LTAAAERAARSGGGSSSSMIARCDVCVTCFQHAYDTRARPSAGPPCAQHSTAHHRRALVHATPHWQLTGASTCTLCWSSTPLTAPLTSDQTCPLPPEPPCRAATQP